MALNKNALIRYRTIDKCLQNRYRKWTLDDLIQACSDALYEYEGRKVKVSKRTVQLDIQMMRSDKLGYEAPIVVYDKKYYTYSEEDFTITDIPLTKGDMQVLSEAVEMLKQFKDFSLFSELGGIIHKLEDKIHTQKSKGKSIIHLDKNESLKGLEHLDTIYHAILKQIVLKIEYQSFKARESNTVFFSAYILKEYNNRWFALGKNDTEDKIITYALDRIIKIDYALSKTYRLSDFDADEHFKNTYGVTVLNDAQLMDIQLWVNMHNAPYVMTKPFHHSQQLLEQYDDGSILIQIKVHHNFEIERLILGFGNGIIVKQPRRLRTNIKWRLQKAIENYNEVV